MAPGTQPSTGRIHRNMDVFVVSVFILTF